MPMAITMSLSTFILWCFTLFVVFIFLGMKSLIVDQEEGAESLGSFYVVGGLFLGALIFGAVLIFTKGFVVVGVIALAVIVLVIRWLGYLLGSWIPERLK